jgi:hypothetical protein
LKQPAGSMRPERARKSPVQSGGSRTGLRGTRPWLSAREERSAEAAERSVRHVTLSPACYLGTSVAAWHWSSQRERAHAARGSGTTWPDNGARDGRPHRRKDTQARARTLGASRKARRQGRGILAFGRTRNTQRGWLLALAHSGQSLIHEAEFGTPGASVNLLPGPASGLSPLRRGAFQTEPSGFDLRVGCPATSRPHFGGRRGVFGDVKANSRT